MTNFPSAPGKGDPLRVYVGTETEQALAFQVLAYSIRRHASGPVEVIALGDALASAGIRIPEPRSHRNRRTTPFSFQRFTIPQLNGYAGRAVYLDSDMVVFRDIYELVGLAPSDADVDAVLERPDSGRRSQISVMVLDCSRLKAWDVGRIIEDLDQGKYSYRELYSTLPIAPRFSRTLPSCWNDLERHTPGSTALTHFTDMEFQPWLYSRHRLGRFWCEVLFDALQAGAVSRSFVLDQAARGWIRPSLAYQVERNIVDPARLPERVVRLDDFGFTPPHRVGLLHGKWMRQIARSVTAYGQLRPGSGARLMRCLQALGYLTFMAVKRISGRSLTAG